MLMNFNFNNFRRMCMDKAINAAVVIVFLIFILFIIFAASISSNSSSIIATSSQALSSKKIGWGIKRSDNHKQPDLGTINKKIIDEFGGYAMGNKDKPYIYLTFDVGYEGGYTSHILDVLKENDVKAVFFITGQFVRTSEDLIKRMIDEGQIIGNHTSKHRVMPDSTEEQIKDDVMSQHQEIYEKFGYEMKYIRPPKGEYSEKSIAYTNSLGYKTIMWSFAYDDWDVNKQGRQEYGKKKILDNLHNGEIMLLHATSKDNSEILDEIIKEAKRQGYEFKSIDEFER